MATKDDLKAAADRLVANNAKLLALVQSIANGDTVSQADAKAVIDELNAASAQDEANGAAPPPAA
jgi:flagella basal body P-ring formation protein FlgA